MTTKNLVRLMNALVETPAHLGLALLISVSVMVGGFYITTVPAQIRERNITALADGITAEKTAVNTVHARWDEVSYWYASAYSDDFNTRMYAVNGKVSEAQAQLAIAKENSSPDEAVSAAFTGWNDLNAVEDLKMSALTVVNTALADREKARAELKESEKFLLGVNGAKGDMERHFAVEDEQYPGNRVEPIRQEILKINGQVTAIEELLAGASSLLPQDDYSHGDLPGIGDPKKALELIAQANAALAVQDTAIPAARTEVNKLTSARQDAQPMLKQADDETVFAEMHIHAATRDRGYRLDGALSEANSLLDQAKAQAEASRQALAVQPKVDFVVAFEAAQAANATTEAIHLEVDAQIAADDESAQVIGQIQGGISEVQALSQQAGADLTVLAVEHKDSTWETVANNVTNVEAILRTVSGKVTNVERFRSVQQFEQARDEGRSGTANLADARSLAEAVSNLRSRLETARATWPDAHSDAVSAISSAEGPVSMFAGYSARAVIGLSNAENLLHEGESFAVDNWFEPAVDRAQRAAKDARAAGTNAQVDHDEEMARRERARQAELQRQREAREQAAREVAREVQRQQQLRDQMNRSNSYSDGGGSCCGSSNYSSPPRSNSGSFSSPSRSNSGAFP